VRKVQGVSFTGLGLGLRAIFITRKLFREFKLSR
jgi:hypothetical protein